MHETTIQFNPQHTETEIKEMMDAAQITRPGVVAIKSVKTPEPGPQQLLIQLEGCGVCASSLPVFEGREWFEYPYSPGAPGHEGWGTVVAIGKDADPQWIGKKVTFLGYHSFASYDLAEQTQVAEIPESLDASEVPGEALGCAFNIARRTDAKPGDTVAIVGMGFLGNLLTQILANQGIEVIAISRREYVLRKAQESGAAHAVKMDDHWRIIDEIKNITNQRLCDKVIEAVGLQWPLDLAGELVAEGGKLIIAGFHQDGLRNVNMQMWNWKGIDVINAHERKPETYISGMKTAINALFKEEIAPQNIYTIYSGLENIQKAFDDLKKRPDGFIKGIVKF